LTELNISGSKDNPKVKDFFKQWNTEIKTMPMPVAKTNNNDDEYIKSLQRTISDLEQRLAIKEKESSEFKKFEGALSHFKSHGIYPK